MSLDISTILEVNPESLPAQGGNVRTTFEASAVGAPSRLRAAYRLAPAGVPFRLVGATELPATEAGLDPRNYSMTLTLQATGDTSDTRNVQIIADVFEVGGSDQGAARGRVFIQPGAGLEGFAAASGGDLAGQMRSFRVTQGLTQEEAAERLGTSRSTISRIERGHQPSDEVLDRLEDVGIETGE